jgi:hypothetical protein
MVDIYRVTSLSITNTRCTVNKLLWLCCVMTVMAAKLCLPPSRYREMSHCLISLLFTSFLLISNLCFFLSFLAWLLPTICKCRGFFLLQLITLNESPGRGISPSYTPIPHNAQHSQQTCFLRDSNPQYPASKWPQAHDLHSRCHPSTVMW